MKHIFSLEKILIHNENMEYTGEQTRIKLFGKIVVSFQSNNKLNTL